MVCVVAALAAVGAFPVPWPVRYFPGRFYETRGAATVERTVVGRWPSPERLVALGWRTGPPRRRVAWLLGAGYFHDPVVLAAYAEALADGDPRVRLAAAYGLAILTGSEPPRERELSPEGVRRLRERVLALERALRERPLVALWLDALLATEGGDGGDGAGALLGGSRSECLRALDRIVDAGDLDAVLAAYRRARTLPVRTALLRLVEGLTCSEFVKLPRGPRAGWGEREFRRGLRRLDGWLGARCRVDEAAVVRASLARLGVVGFDPYGPEACDVWVQVLERGPDVFRPLASRQLVRCGAPPFRISFWDRDGRLARRQRGRLLAYYGYGKVGVRRPARARRRRP